MNDRQDQVATKAVPSPAILIATSFAFIIVQLDVTIVNVALPKIGVELGASVAALQWVVDAYTLGFAVLLLAAGSLGDRFGASRVLLCGFALFAFASAACAMAPSAIALNLARAAQGVGAALLVPSSLSILNAAFAHDKRMLAKAIGWWTAAGGVSIAAGPVVGGVLLSMGSWRNVFWVNVPICLIGFVLTRRLVSIGKDMDSSREFDFAGQFLSVVSLTALIAAVIELHALGWTHVFIQCALALAILSSAAFLLVESRVNNPMLPLRLFHSRAFTGAVLFGVIVNFAYYGIIFVLSFYLQTVRHLSVLETGLTFVPLTATFIFSNIASGWMVARTGARFPMVLGGVIAGTGYAALGWLGISTNASFLQMLPGLILIPAGMGLAVPAMTTSILGSVARSKAGTASAVLNAARQIGGAIGVAAFGAMVAEGTPQKVTAGVQATLAVAAALLGAGALLAWWCKPTAEHTVASENQRSNR